MSNFSALFRTPHPNRLELLITGGRGPMKNQILGDLDPQRDLQIYIDGRPIEVSSSKWDATGNRYLLYFDENLTSNYDTIQIIHHVPEPPFLLTSNPILSNITPGSQPTMAERLEE